MPATRVLLILGLLFFLAALATLWGVLEGGAHPLWPGLALLGLAVASLGLAAWRLHTRIDFDRIMDEQRLWESGRLGRLWLRIRRR